MFNRIYEWNKVRDNLEYDKCREYEMLDEELIEYLISEDPANAAKELADVIFVAMGSLIKLTGSPAIAESIMNRVIAHNSVKGSKKDENGKVIKGEIDWKVEDKIREEYKEVFV
jgi:hypothetical protein